MALFCTDTFSSAYGDRIAEIAPISKWSCSGRAKRSRPMTSSASRSRSSPTTPGPNGRRRSSRWRSPPEHPVVALDVGRRRQPRVLDVPRSRRPADHVVRRERAADRRHGDAVPAGAQPEPARVAPSQAAHEWSPAPFPDLEGQRVVVVGYGPIGQEVVRLATAFRMDPVVVRRSPAATSRARSARCPNSPTRSVTPMRWSWRSARRRDPRDHRAPT